MIRDKFEELFTVFNKESNDAATEYDGEINGYLSAALHAYDNRLKKLSQKTEEK